MRPSSPAILARLLHLYRPYLGWLALGIAVSLVTLLANVALMGVSGWFIAAMALAGTSGGTLDYFTPAAVIRFCAIVRTGGRYVERLIAHEATFRLLAGLRRWVFDHIEPLAPAGLRRRRGGDLLSRLRADIDTLEAFYLRILAPTVVALLAGGVFTLFLARYHPVLAAVEALFLVLAGVAVPAMIGRFGATPARRTVETAAELRATAVDSVQGMAELLAYGVTRRQQARFTELGDRLLDDQKRLADLDGIAQGTVGLAANTTLGLMLILGIPLVAEGGLARPDLAMLALFGLASFEAVMPLPGAMKNLGAALAAARRIFELVDTPLPVAAPAATPPSAVPVVAHLRFAGVRFRYDADASWAVDGLTLDLPPGGRLAVVGATGSGKSSLIHLLFRFQDPQEGMITLGGRPLDAFSPFDLRRHFAVVPQQARPFTGSLRDNLLLADPLADDTALLAACRLAGLGDFVQGLPDGLATPVGAAGLKLSGGEARRLAIARALVRRAPILILDEPGEGLDPMTERDILARLLAEDRSGRALLLITHRLAGLQAMDEVIVLDGGRIVERGTPAALMAQGTRLRRFADCLRPSSSASGGRWNTRPPTRAT